MLYEHLQKQFAKMGAKVQVSVAERSMRPFAVDIKSVEGERVFDIAVRDPKTQIDVLQVNEYNRHLLLLVRPTPKDKHKFLCGHDERDWFVAAVPEPSAKNVNEAKEALKPALVREVQANSKARKKKLEKRHNPITPRQGEWFFIPTPHLNPPALMIHKKEPITRGGGSKPHVCEQLYRIGGTRVRANSKYPTGLTDDEFMALPEEEKNRLGWRSFVRDPVVYVRGRVSHPDHKTLNLLDWHRVMVNTEGRAASRSYLTFLD